jgi:hypothetical protein
VGVVSIGHADQTDDTFWGNIDLVVPEQQFSQVMLQKRIYHMNVE